MFNHTKAMLSSLASGKACKKTRIQSVVCLLVASASVTLSSLSAFALYQSNASTGTPVDVEGLRKSDLFAKDIKSQNVVEKDGLQFETLIPEAVIKIPENKLDARSLIRFGCRITNKTPNPIRINWFQTLKPQTIASSSPTTRGTTVGWGGTSESILPFFPSPPDYPREEISSKATFPLLMPKESTTFFLNGYLFWYQNKLTIQLGDFNSYSILYHVKPGSGTVSLNAGEYDFWFNYKNQDEKVRNSLLEANEGQLPKENLWVGSIQTPVVKFRLVNSR